MSESAFPPLQDDDWVTSRSVQKQQQQQQPLQRQQRRSSYLQTTTMSMTVTSQSLERPRRQAPGNNRHQYKQRTFEFDNFFRRQEPSFQRPISEPPRPGHIVYSDSTNNSVDGLVMRQFGGSRLERQPQGSANPEGIWNAFTPQYTPKDWANWINDQQKSEQLSRRPTMAREASGSMPRPLTASSSSRPASGATAMTPPPTNRAVKITEIGSSSAMSKVAPTRPLATSVTSTAPPATVSGLTSLKSNSPVGGGGAGRSDHSSPIAMLNPTENLSSTPSLISVEAQRPGEASALKDLLGMQELLDLDFDTTAPSQTHIPAALADLIDLDFSISTTPETSALIDFSESDPILSSISIPSSTNSDSLIDAMDSTHGLTGLLGELSYFGGNQNEIIERPAVGAELLKGQEDTHDLLSFEDMHITEDTNRCFYSGASDREHDSDSDDNHDDDSDNDNDSDDSDSTTTVNDDLWRAIGDNRIGLDMATLENIRIDLENAGVTWDELTRVKL